MAGQVAIDLSDLLQNKVNLQRNTHIDVIYDHIDYSTIDFRPRVNENVVYIVSAVLFNNFGEVLMIQESRKEKGKGKWYLPAGRVNTDESYEDAVKRRVKSETGLEFTPTTLVAVECCTGHWYRYCFTGTIAGGQLKDKKRADNHSVQAKWFPVKYVVHQQGIQLRSHDILLLLNMAVAHKSKTIEHPDLLPTSKAHKELLYRLVLVYVAEENNAEVFKVLVSKKEGVYHFPTAEINPVDSWVLMALYRILKDAFGRDDIRTRTRGLLTLEHSGRPAHRNDGLCMTALVSMKEVTEMQPTTDYEWVPVTDPELEADLHGRIMEDASVSLLDIY